MTKRIKSKFQICKKFHGLHKNLWGVFKAAKFRSIKIFKKNVFLVNQKKNRLTAFGRYLNTKQLVKNFYSNISEQKFQKYLNKSIISKAPSIRRFFSVLESRVDTILFRSCLVNSLHMGRQLINHKKIFINNKLICCSSILAKPNDIISLSSKKGYLQNKIVTIVKQKRFKQYYFLSIKIRKSFNFFFDHNLFKSMKKDNRIFTSNIHKIFFKKFNVYLKLKKVKNIDLIPKNLEVNFQIFKVIFLWDLNYQKIFYPINIKYKKNSKSTLSSFNNLLYHY